MADLVTGLESEILVVYESDNIPYIQNVESLISQGTYVKLTNREFIFIDMSQVYESTVVTPKPVKYGYINNTTTLNFTVAYHEE